MPSGRLFICPTPIGNLEDITIRAIRVLRAADLIAAEDTRRTAKLLARYRIKTAMISYHAHAEKQKAGKLIERLKAGDSIALVSDAGTPGISDPGFDVVRACIENGIAVEALPGPSSILPALVLSGLPTDRFTFMGFFPRKQNERQAAIEDLSARKETAIFFERASRLPDMAGCLVQLEPLRKVVVVRELTKKFEEIIRGNTGDIAKKVEEVLLKGEVVVIIEGACAQKASFETVSDKFVSLVTRGMKRNEAIKLVAKEFNWDRRELYDRLTRYPE